MSGDTSIVTFGIPLIARSVALNWNKVLHQLNATIGSIYNQDDPNFRVIVACTDRPEMSVATDERLEFIAADEHGTSMSFRAQNADAGRKRWAIAERLHQYGGGFLMATDADDLISSKLVSFVRQQDHPHGHFVGRGYILDGARGLLAPFPLANLATDSFDRVCGTCAIIRYHRDDLPDGSDKTDTFYSRINLKGHAHVRDNMAAEGRPLLELPFRAVTYVRNTGENLSARRTNLGETHRLAWQANILRETKDQGIERTTELDAEFNLKAAISPSPGSTDSFVGGNTAGPRLSVVVTTYRRPAGLRRLLSALRPQVENRDDRQIIVVNDGSHDAAYENLIDEFRDVVEYKALAENIGIAAARNESARLASGEYLVFTDDDCEPPDWWLDWLSSRLKIHPEIDVVAGMTEPLWPDRRSFVARVQAHYKFIPHPWQADHRFLFVTANAAVRRSIFHEVGEFGFADNFSGAGEDTELSVRLNSAGARMVVDWNWFVRHEVGGRLSDHIRRYWRYGYANVAMTRLQTAPKMYAELATAGRRRHFRQAADKFRSYRAQSKEFSKNPFSRIASAAAATAIQVAYFDGCAKAARERQKELAAGRI